MDIDDIINSINPEEQKDYIDKIVDSVKGDLTGLYDRRIKKYKDKELLVKGTKEVLQDQKKLLESREKQLVRMKNLISDIMKKTKQDKFESKYGKISYKKCTRTIVDEKVLSKSFMTENTTRTPNKILIKEQIKAGVEVEGAYLEKTLNLNIK